MEMTSKEFRQADRAGRVRGLAAEGLLTEEQAATLLKDVPVLPLSTAEQMIENVIGVFGLPLGLVPGVPVNGREYDVPMVIEEPSVVAAQANSAKVLRASGGYRAGSTEPVMIGQIQVLNVPDMDQAVAAVDESRDRIIDLANEAIGGIVRRGGGCRDLIVRRLRHPEDSADMLVLHLHIDTREAMGANAVNTAAEACASRVEDITGGDVVLRILSNLTDRRRSWAEAEIPVDLLQVRDTPGAEVALGIERASKLAEIDPYRAATHNKGAMNGVDAVVLATGNDFRAVEAGAHAWAAREGRYGSLSQWRVRGDVLWGRIELPLALGTVGGMIRSHPWVPVLLDLMQIETASELAQVVAAVGLGQNLGALRALASVGIQAGHMAMHARSVALSAGARPEEVDAVVRRMRERGAINSSTAAEVLAAVRGSG